MSTPPATDGRTAAARSAASLGPTLQPLLDAGALRDPISLRPLSASLDGRYLISAEDGRCWPVIDGVPRLVRGQERSWPL